MRRIIPAQALILSLVLGFAIPALAQEPAIGRTVDSLLDYARNNNPEYASMRHEADAPPSARHAAGALPDPKFRVELMDITKMGEQNPTLLPNQVGSTKYTVLQELPWYGKRDLKRGIAEMQAEAAQGQLRGAWAEIAAQLKTAHAQLYLLNRNEHLTREILGLMVRLEKDAQARYANGLAMQQDVIRSQIEQTGMRNDLIMLENERTMLRAHQHAAGATVQCGAREPGNAAAADTCSRQAGFRDAGRPHSHAQSATVHRRSAHQIGREDPRADLQGTLPRLHARRDAGAVRRFKEWQLMLEFNIPLQQSSRRAMERESESMLSAARSRKEATANQVLSGLAENLSGIEAARRTETLAGRHQLVAAGGAELQLGARRL